MIHKFFHKGLYIVLDVNSGTLLSVDKCAYDIIDHVVLPLPEVLRIFSDKHDKTVITEAYGELKRLIADDLLFSADNTDSFYESSATPVLKALCILLAADCNLRCGYCFADTGSFFGKRALMPRLTAEKAIDFLIAHSGSRQSLEVDFFGGEPLLNYEVLKETVYYATDKAEKHGKKINFTLTTNGTLIDDEKIEYINANMQNVVLSIDGRKEVHDFLRKTISGKGSYATIIPKIQKLIEKRGDKDYYIRGTFTARNLDFSKDAAHLADLGFRHISIEPIVSAADMKFSLKNEHLPIIFSEYEQLLERVRTDAFSFFHFNIDLAGGPCVYKRLSGCGAGTEYLAVTPSGDLYPCHQIAGNTDYRLGDIITGVCNSPMIENKTELFKYPLKKSACAACWAKFYCGGGCAAAALNIEGDINKPYELGCQMQKKRTEMALIKAIDM